MHRFLINSRSFKSALFLGLLAVMLGGYQNCGKANFNRTGDDSHGGSKPCNQKETGCVPASGAEVIPVVQNGANYSIGDQESTCKNLVPGDITNGHHRDVTISLLALHFIPDTFKCRRVRPLADSAFYDCNLPSHPGQTFRIDGGEFETPPRLGQYNWTSTDSTSAQIHFVNVTDGSYEIEFMGTKGSGNSQFSTNISSVRFTVSDCNTTPTPTPTPQQCNTSFYNTNEECSLVYPLCEQKFVCVTEPCNCSWGPAKTSAPACQPGFFNTNEECSATNPLCEQKFVCVTEPCNCSWGPAK